MPIDKPVIIIGGGIVGLTLANGLKQAGIPFKVYERDNSVGSRGQGWAITIHWALPHLQEVLSPPVYTSVLDTQVDHELGRNDTGTFLFLNLATLEAKFRIPPSKRARISRERARQALLEGVKDQVHWSKRLVDVTTKQSVIATFDDGTHVEGSVLVGAEGSNSKTRQILRPDNYRNHQLPVRFIGVSVAMTAEEVKPLRDLDPLLFQGAHPDTGVYLWVSMLHVPQASDTTSDLNESYRVQINMSWIVQFPSQEVAIENAQRLLQMRAKADGFHPTLKAVVEGIPDDTEVLEIKLADWPCQQWENRGLLTLVGDAAHAMTMYRGEAANHGILDAFELLKHIQSVHNGQATWKSALDAYEMEMRERTSTAVLLSRQACIDAHDFNGLNEHSAVLKRRAIAAA